MITVGQKNTFASCKSWSDSAATYVVSIYNADEQRGRHMPLCFG
jgi:hypothetical protein